MVLFGVMALFLAQAVALAQFGEFIQRKWHVWECTPLVSKADEEERYKSLKAAAKLAKNPATFWTFALKNRMSEKYRLVLHTAARLRFVEENGLAHSDFDFARYLAVGSATRSESWLKCLPRPGSCSKLCFCVLAGRRPSRPKYEVIFVVSNWVCYCHRDVRDSRQTKIDPARLLRALRRS